jgi:hypothetical protein
MPIDLPPYDSGSQPTLAFAPFSEVDCQKIREWQFSPHADLRQDQAARHLKCCDEWMAVNKDGLHCQKCGNEQDWVPGIVMMIDLTRPP